MACFVLLASTSFAEEDNMIHLYAQTITPRLHSNDMHRYATDGDKCEKEMTCMTIPYY